MATTSLSVSTGTVLLTGMRPGEVAGLCWDAIDLKAGTLTIKRAVQMNAGRPNLTDDLKTKASRRTIAVDPEAIEILKAQRTATRRAKLAAKQWIDLDLVFPMENGQPWPPRTVRQDLERICVKAELPRVRPNELRHTAASILSDRGVAHAQIADLLGHTTTQMVDRTYRHNIRAAADASVTGGLGDLARPN